MPTCLPAPQRLPRGGVDLNSDIVDAECAGRNLLLAEGVD